jgi:uncharacterized protein (DUF2236 family)
VRNPSRWLPDSAWERLRVHQNTAQLFAMRGTLPAGFRTRIGLQWTDSDQRRFDRFRFFVRVVGTLTPVSARSTLVRTIGRLNVWLRARPKLHRALAGPRTG